MKRITLILALLAFFVGAPKPAAAQNRYIVRSTGGLSSVLNLCNLLECQVQGGLDGQVGQTFLVTSSNNLLGSLVNGTVTLVESLLGIVSIEADRLLPIPQTPLNSIPYGLYDTAPVNYYGNVAWHGYVVQPAAQMVRLLGAPSFLRPGGARIAAVIAPCVNVIHHLLAAAVVQGYEITRK